MSKFRLKFHRVAFKLLSNVLYWMWVLDCCRGYLEVIKHRHSNTGVYVHVERFCDHQHFSPPLPAAPTPRLNPLNPELNPICYSLGLLAHHFLHVSRIRAKSLTIKLLMSYIYIYIYIYMERLFLMFLDHTQRRTTVSRTPLDK